MSFLVGDYGGNKAIHCMYVEIEGLINFSLYDKVNLIFDRCLTSRTNAVHIVMPERRDGFLRKYHLVAIPTVFPVRQACRCAGRCIAFYGFKVSMSPRRGAFKIRASTQTIMNCISHLRASSSFTCCDIEFMRMIAFTCTGIFLFQLIQ